MTAPPFAYAAAFDRNIGWLTEWEQLALRARRVAIAGMGGVGGIHLLSLARLGIGRFSIADLDDFDIVNFNRQFGAYVSTLGRPKVEVLAEMARDINPELDLRSFPAGVQPETIDAFLEGVDLYVDGLDFFQLDIRRQVFARCHALGIPAVTAAPIGMGTGFLVFEPGGMSFDQYFRLDGKSAAEQYVRFLVGFTPRGLHLSYVVDPTRVDLAGQRGPSTVAACDLCAGVVAVAAVKLLLRRGGVAAAPYHHHYDAYRGRLVVSKLRWGNAGPLQQLKIAIGRRMFARMSARAVPPMVDAGALDPLGEILNLARWAPSPDNTQNWRFERLGADRVRVRVALDHATNIYQYRTSEPTRLAVGMLLESLRIAASGWQRTIAWSIETETDVALVLLVTLAPAPALAPDPLLAEVPLRSVDRRAFRVRALRAHERDALREAAGAGLALEFHAPVAARFGLARLAARATDIRLRAPEALDVHRDIIDWEREHSPTGIPARAVGVDPLTRRLMRWAMANWGRMKLVTRLGATVLTAVELDYLPMLRSAAGFSLRFTAAGEKTTADVLEAGARIQRFWLTASALGLAMQPALAILAFAEYGERGQTFSREPALLRKAVRLAEAFQATMGAAPGDFVFLGRIGEPYRRLPVTRSTRLGLEALVVRGSEDS